MGWFDEQIRDRARNDDASFAQAFADMAGAVLGRPPFPEDERQRAHGAIRQVLAWYRLPCRDEVDAEGGIEPQLEQLTAPHGLMHRRVSLHGAWYREAIGPLLGTTTGGQVVALLPGRLAGYSYTHPDSGRTIRLNARTAAGIAEDALCFYLLFPLRRLRARDLLAYIVKALPPRDLVMILVLSLMVTALGLLLPRLHLLLFGPVLARQAAGLLLPVAMAMVGLTLSLTLFAAAKALILSQLESRLDLMVQSAAMMRVLSLPAPFFQQFNPGELTSRVRSVGSLCSLLANLVLLGGLSSLLSLAYVGQISLFAPALALPALIVLLSTLALALLVTRAEIRQSQERMEIDAKEQGMVFSLIGGVQKIKLAGAEKRAFSKWAFWYNKGARLSYDPPALLRFGRVLPMAISLLGTVLIYYIAVRTGVSTAEYMAFSLSFGMVGGAFASLAGLATQASELRPMLKMINPILQAEPEIAGSKKALQRFGGAVELSHVSFRYLEGQPLVLDDLSLKIRPGDYVAVVGRTGYGKSTLIRLLLGFERPQRGAVYYDGQDLNTLDLRSVRRHIGVVTQDGKLFQGSVFSNIAISCPTLTLQEAWEAAEMAGIAQDIRDMPMGMHTILSEGEGGISGGQRQRLMIARAIAPKPRLLMLDEATSALDNITQKQVSAALGELKCTRIVIAHRLSTIRQCNRILVLSDGRIAEDGTYDQLLTQGGIFAGLVARQQLNPGE